VENLKEYMDLYTPLVAQFTPQLIKDLKKDISEIGEKNMRDLLSEVLEQYDKPSSDIEGTNLKSIAKQEEENKEALNFQKRLDDDEMSVAFYYLTH